MRIEYETDPVEGQDFVFTLVDVQPPATIVYYVGNRPYGEAACEERSCERVAIVPAQTAGEFLRLVVQDATETEEYRLKIGEAV